jgi:ABC-2 type transport system ATP-binding protein
MLKVMYIDKAIVVENIVKRYRVKKKVGFLRSATEVVEALRGVSFSVNYGEVVGLLGPNGAGKTTTIKVLATLLTPDSGEAYVAGYNVVKESDKVRKKQNHVIYKNYACYAKSKK